MLEPRLKETRATVEFRYRLEVMPLLSRGPLLSGFNSRPKHQGYFRGDRYFRYLTAGPKMNVTFGEPLL